MRSRESKKQLNKKKLFIFIGIALIVITGIILGILGLIKITNKGDGGLTEPEEKEEEVVEKEEPIKIIDVNSKTRPYAIMINCKGEALPQSGLQDAYIVYELLVEGGITRMLAIFKDKTFDKVGSIRSARNQYLGYVFENDAILVHAGGSVEALNRIANEGINHIDADGQYGVRDRELAKVRAWEHTLFTNSNLLTNATNNQKIRSTTETKTLLNYSANEVDLSKYETKEANNVSIKYSDYRTSNYTYDSENKVYLRSMNNTKNIDLVTGKQYEVKNILIYGIQHTSYTDNGYYGYQRLSNIGQGEGYYVTNGVALPITWEKKDEKSQTVYKVKETGEELIVNDGNTYVQIYPTNGGNLTIN